MEETETTNKVLETKIDGLAKLTDERFLNIKETLVRIEQNSSGFVSKNELEEVKKDFNKTIIDIRDGFAKHNVDDKESFGGLAQSQSDLRDTIKTWGGALVVIAILLPIIAPLVFHYLFHI